MSDTAVCTECGGWRAHAHQCKRGKAHPHLLAIDAILAEWGLAAIMAGTVPSSVIASLDWHEYEAGLKGAAVTMRN